MEQHSLSELFNILESYYIQSKVPICVLDSIDGILKFYADSGALIWTRGLIEYMLRKRNNVKLAKDQPFLVYSPLGIFAGIIIYEDVYIGIGPTMIANIPLSDLYKSYSDILSAGDISSMHSIAHSAPRMDIETFSNTLSIINKLVNGNFISYTSIIESNTDYYTRFAEIADTGSLSYSGESAEAYIKNLDMLIDFENSLEQAVKSGNRDRITKLWENPDRTLSDIILSVPQHSSYLFIRVITIMNRAALSAGADEQSVFRLTDMYVGQMNVSAVTQDKYSILKHAAYAFCGLVNTVISRGAFALPAKKCIRYIEENLSVKITVGDLAILCNMSERQVFRVFKESFNTTVSDYITEKRLEKAITLLKNTLLPISEICLECGFNSQSYFTKIFHERYKVSPTEFRKGLHPLTE